MCVPSLEPLANFTVERWGRSLGRWGQAGRAVRQSLQLADGLMQLGRGSLVERGSWVGEIARSLRAAK